MTAAVNYTIPPPPPLEIHDTQAAETWKRFRRAWENYLLATGLNEKSEAVQVTTLLTVIGEEAHKVYSTFSGWENDGNNKKIGPVLAKLNHYCEPQKNIPFQRYCFNRRCQEPGESYDQYCTALRKLAESCNCKAITPIRDSKTQERLLREPALTLRRTDEVCHAAESMTKQLKLVGDNQGTDVSAVSQGAETRLSPTIPPTSTQECRNCGRKHSSQRRELCPAFGKTC